MGSECAAGCLAAGEGGKGGGGGGAPVSDLYPTRGCLTPAIVGGKTGGGGGGGAKGRVMFGVHTAAGVGSAGTVAAETGMTGGISGGCIKPVVLL